MKLVKISLVLLALAFCMPAMAYKTATFQTGNKVIDGVVDSSYNMDFVAVKAAKTGTHCSSYQNQIMVGYDPDNGTGGGTGGEQVGACYVMARFPITSLQGKVKYIHSGYVTLWSVAQTSAAGLAVDHLGAAVAPKHFGLKWNKAVAAGNANKPVRVFYVNPAVTTQCANWGDADATTDPTNIQTAPGCTWQDFGTATSKVWQSGWGPFFATNAPPYVGAYGALPSIVDDFDLISAADTIDDDLQDSVVMQFAIPQQKLEKWLNPAKFNNEINAGFGLVFLRTNGGYEYSNAGAGFEGYFFVDDGVDENIPESYNLGNRTTVAYYRHHIPRTVGNNELFACKANRPKLTVLYEEGTNVPVELSSFDVE